MIDLSILPTVNAFLNSLSTVFLLSGFLMIKMKKVVWHKGFMITAFATSTLFLISYLFYHYHAGSTRFPGIGPIRVIYFSILFTHTVLAAAVPFLAAVTLYRAWKQQWERHRRIARWTLPIWLYVSITGVVIYWMLYHRPV